MSRINQTKENDVRLIKEIFKIGIVLKNIREISFFLSF